MKVIDAMTKGNPREAKISLAKEIVRMYHGNVEALKQADQWVRTFSKGEAPSDISVVKLEGRELADALVAAGIVSSKTDYRRLDEALHLAGQHSSATVQLVCERVAAQCVRALDRVRGLEPAMPKYVREEVYH